MRTKLMTGAAVAAMLFAQSAFGQTAPVYDPTSLVTGETNLNGRHQACIWVEPKAGGDYGIYDSDTNPTTGVTRVCIPATVSVAADGKTVGAGGGGGGGGAVTVVDGGDVAQGTTTDGACSTDNGTCTVEAILKRIAQRNTTINTSIGTGNTSLASVDAALGGSAAAVASDTGASTSNGFLRYFRDIWFAITAIHGSVKTVGTTIYANDGTVVDWSAVVPVSQSGTWTFQPGNTPNTTPWLTTTQEGAQCDDTAITALSEGTYGSVRLSCTNHALITRPYETAANSWSYPAASGGITNSTAGVTAHAACGSGLKNYISGIQLSSDALGVATEFVIRDGAAGTVLWRSRLQTAGLVGNATPWTPPISGTANTLIQIDTETASVTGGVYANLQGYCAP